MDGGRPGVPPLQQGVNLNSIPVAGDREGHPYSFTETLSETWRAGADTRPYGRFGSRHPISPGPVPDRSTGGHMGPPLRVKRTALITGTVPLIRHGFAAPPSPQGKA